jgi:hypothetical protein
LRAPMALSLFPVCRSTVVFIMVKSP